MADEQDSKIDYIEMPATDLARSKAFYGAVFGWSYKDWGPDYADTTDGRIGSGLNAGADHRPRAPLVTLYANELEAAREIFPFPGGRRFQFEDPAGNELAVWSRV